MGRIVSLEWTAPGDDGTQGQATGYEVRYLAEPLTAENWGTAASPAPPSLPKPAGQREQLEFTGIADGTWHFAVRTKDESGNQSVLSNDAIATVADGIAPAQVVDLRVTAIYGHSVTVEWTAPGNDGSIGTASVYDLRYSASTITEETWEAATRVTGVGAPGPAGSVESFAIGDLTSGQAYYVALRSADGRPNWSPLSNVVELTPLDQVPPGQVTDLSITDVTVDRVALRWTAPGDDGSVGRASTYELRYASEALTTANWLAATPIPGIQEPDSAGTLEDFSVEGLVPDHLYYFALRATDGASNWSALSNVVSAVPSSAPLRQITVNPVPGGRFGAFTPAWSPDGSTIAFAADWTKDSFSRDLYLIPANGGAPRRLTNDSAASNEFPTWAPDGQFIAFSSTPPLGAGPSSIWIAETAGTMAPTRLAGQIESARTPSWSPDGTRIAYVYAPSREVSSLQVIPSGGGTSTPVTDEHFLAYGPAWSRDGLRLALQWNRSGHTEIWVVSAQGGAETQLTDFGATGPPAWSPDGARIAITSSRSGSPDIWIISLDGSEPIQLTSDPAEDAQPAWSPDGLRIAFTSNRSGTFEIWVQQIGAP